LVSRYKECKNLFSLVIGKNTSKLLIVKGLPLASCVVRR